MTELRVAWGPDTWNESLEAKSTSSSSILRRFFCRPLPFSAPNVLLTPIASPFQRRWTGTGTPAGDRIRRPPSHCVRLLDFANHDPPRAATILPPPTPEWKATTPRPFVRSRSCPAHQSESSAAPMRSDWPPRPDLNGHRTAAARSLIFVRCLISNTVHCCSRSTTETGSCVAPRDTLALVPHER